MVKDTNYNKPIRLGPVALTTVTTTNIWNPPSLTGGTPANTSNTYLLISRIRVTNKTAIPAQVGLWLGATGANAAGTEAIFGGIAAAGALTAGVNVPAQSYVDWSGELRMDVADFLVGGASAAGALTIAADGEIGSNTAALGLTPHRYWRLNILSISGAATGVVIGELEMHTSIGGATVCSGGTASASSQYSASYSADKAFAGDGATTRWAASSGAPPPYQWIEYDFGAGNDKAIVEVAIMGASDLGNTLTQSPGTFIVEFSDDNIAWTAAWWVQYPGGSNGHGYVTDTFKTFTKPTETTPTRYWMFAMTGSNGGSYVGTAELEFRQSFGGADETGSGTPTAGSTFGGLPIANAFDNNTATDWASNNAGFPEWINYDFGAGNNKAIVEVSYLPRAGFPGSQSPTGIYFMSSGDGISFLPLWSSLSISGWSAGVAKIFQRP